MAKNDWFKPLFSDIKNKKYLPVYFLHGEESYYIDAIADYLSDNVLDDSEKAFNQTVVYGKEAEVGQILEAAKRFPMMAEKQVVIVKEAQQLKKIEELEPYFETPLESTVLIICHKYKKVDARKAFAKKLSKNGMLFYSERLYDNQIPTWIAGYSKSKGYTVEPKAAQMLVEFLGLELSKISNELDKLFITLEGKTNAISAKHVEENIGISKDYNNFELTNALASKDVLKANKIINYFASNPKNNPLVVTNSMLYSFFSKVLMYQTLKNKGDAARELGVNPYFLKDYQQAAGLYSIKKVVAIVAYIREYDLKSKGVGNANVPDGELLKELIYKILH